LLSSPPARLPKHGLSLVPRQRLELTHLDASSALGVPKGANLALQWADFPSSSSR
jgi:hypothetical protein